MNLHARRRVVSDWVRGALWVLPTASVLVFLLAGAVLSRVEVEEGSPLAALAFQGTAEDARSLLVVVSIVIIALIVYVLTIEKIRSIATLKLIGASNWVIVRMIMEQSLALTLGSFAAAYALRQWVAPGFPRTLAFLPHETAVTFVVMLVGGVVASLMAIWHALRTPPSLALGG